MGGRTRTSRGQSSDKRVLGPGGTSGEKIPTHPLSTISWQEGRGISFRGTRVRGVHVGGGAGTHSRDWPEWLGVGRGPSLLGI